MYNDNLARKYNPKKRGEAVSVTMVRKLKKVHKKARFKDGMSFWLSVLLVVFVAGSLLVLSRNVAVTEQRTKVSELKKEYSLLETENRKREIEISRKVDIATVEEKAISVCNMNRARQDQIMYINVQAEDYGVVAKKQEKEEDNSIIRGLLAYLK